MDIAGFCVPSPTRCTQCIQAGGRVPFGLCSVLWVQPTVQGKQRRSGYKSIVGGTENIYLDDGAGAGSLFL